MTETTNLPPEDDNEAAGNLPPAPVKAKRAPAKEATVSEVITAEQSKRRKIILEENDNIPPTGLFIGINGRSFVIRAGEEVLVPLEVIAVLDDAVEDVPRVDGNSNVVDYRRKMRFPYRVIM
jgi:hypothetical protein